MSKAYSDQVNPRESFVKSNPSFNDQWHPQDEDPQEDFFTAFLTVFFAFLVAI
jgi:hypothetical protein